MLHFDNAECLSERIGAVGSACLVLNASSLSSMQHLLKNKIKMKKKNNKELTNCITREQPGLAHTRPRAAAASSGAVQRGFGAGQGLVTPVSCGRFCGSCDSSARSLVPVRVRGRAAPGSGGTGRPRLGHGRRLRSFSVRATGGSCPVLAGLLCRGRGLRASLGLVVVVVVAVGAARGAAVQGHQRRLPCPTRVPHTGRGSSAGVLVLALRRGPVGAAALGVHGGAAARAGLGAAERLEVCELGPALLQIGRAHV